MLSSVFLSIYMAAAYKHTHWASKHKKKKNLKIISASKYKERHVHTHMWACP